MDPIWAFLLGSGLRIGELVWLRWPNVDLKRRQVHVVEFVTALGYDLVASSGKSCDAVRTIELDDGLVRVLRAERTPRAHTEAGRRPLSMNRSTSAESNRTRPPTLM